MFVIKFGTLHFKDYSPYTEELIYTNCKEQAMKFSTLEELDNCVASFNIEGYSVGVEGWHIRGQTSL